MNLWTRWLCVLAVAITLLAIDAPADAASGVVRPSCATSTPWEASCFTLLETGPRALAANGVPAGLGPAALAAAYRLPIGRGAGSTIAIVDAFDDPNAEADLGVYRATFGLPRCTTANGCFRKLNQAGVKGGYPPVSAGWAIEISLDVDMVSAACPRCKITLVEANSPAVTDLAAAEDTAAASGALAISNSYGTDEFTGMQTLAAHYRHPGVTVLVSSGDAGFKAAQYPAVLPSVLGVGGTSLQVARNARGYTEHAWSLAGSGCSAYVAKPSWQRDDHCHMRTVADVSAVADPATGVAVYDTVPYLPGRTWYLAGGTSASTPLVAGAVGLSGRAIDPSYPYTHRGRFNDVVGGSNATINNDCGGDYLCTAKKGYDAPTGWGTPNGAL